MDNIDIYYDKAIILSKKTPKRIVSFITILIVLIFILVILFNITFDVYKNYQGYVILDSDKSYIKFLINRSDFPLNKNNKLYIENEYYKYKIIDIENNIVTLDLDLLPKLRIHNNMVSIRFKTNKTTIFKIIKNKIKKGFGI